LIASVEAIEKLLREAKEVINRKKAKVKANKSTPKNKLYQVRIKYIKL